MAALELHITNGDGAANLLKASSIQGDVLPWRDPMHHGPFPDGDLDKVSEVRAKYLAGDGNNPAEVIRDFELRNTHLRGFANYDAVILWFEHDLLDQLQILQILDWFSERELSDGFLQMVCIDAFAGIELFRGLGQLTPDQIGRLYAKRKPVTSEQLHLAKAAWAAFRSSDPLELTSLLEGNLFDLPFLKNALRRHLEEFPSHETGLTRSEAQIMTLVRNGVHSPVDIFVQNMDMETALFMGDWSTFAVIERLCNAELLTCEPATFWYPAWTAEDRPSFKAQRLEITPIGEQILDGHTSAFDVLNRDLWLGGIHLDSSEPMWTWSGPMDQLIKQTA